MSWSVQAAGKTESVLSDIDQQLSKIVDNKYVTDPAEQRQVLDVRNLLHGFLTDFKGTTGVDVKANGSMSVYNGNTLYVLNISVNPFWHWVE